MSEFWKRKLRTYFFRFDFDNDGVIKKDDWLSMPHRFANFQKADKKKEEHLKTQFDNVWELFVKTADDKKQMTVDVFTDSIGKQLYNPELMNRFCGLIHGIFDLMDFNRDGYLQEDEFHTYFFQLGIPDTSYTKEAFRAVDVNHDGKLSFDEFINAFWDFFFSQNEKSPNAFFFGPLVD